jgi:hypothetical protein
MPSPFIRTTVLILLCLPLWAVERVAASSIEILPHWSRGDSFDLMITRTREKSVDGQSTVSGKTHTRFTVEVLRADRNGYLVGWTAGDTGFEVPASSESFLRHVVGLMKGLQIVLQIDPRGTITGVQNWKELKGETLKVLDAVLANTPDSQKENTEYLLMSKLRAQWETMFGTKEQIERLCTRDARIYFMVLGRAYIPDKPLTYDDQLPNPLGGEPFPARTTIALKTFDNQSGQALLTKNQTTDPQHALRIMESMVKEMSARQGKKAPERQLSKAIAMEDHVEIAVDVNMGWVTKLTRTQSVLLGTRTQTDVTSIVRAAK